jgi:hypothetical protein
MSHTPTRDVGEPRTPLARVFWPRTRIVLTRDAVRLFGAGAPRHEAVRELLDRGVRIVANARPIDVTADPTDYRDRGGCRPRDRGGQLRQGDPVPSRRRAFRARLPVHLPARPEPQNLESSSKEIVEHAISVRSSLREITEIAELARRLKTEGTLTLSGQ